MPAPEARPWSRFAVLGDIHAEHVRVRAALGHARAEGVDGIVSVGDLVDGPGDVDEVINQLRAASAVVVRGNHERWLFNKAALTPADRRHLGWTLPVDLTTESLTWLLALPATCTVTTAWGEMLVAHGVGDNDMERFDSHTPL